MDSPEYQISSMAEYLLLVFQRLSYLRESGINGPEPIQPRTIREWCEATGMKLHIEEVDIIFKADAVYRKAYELERKSQEERAELRRNKE